MSEIQNPMSPYRQSPGRTVKKSPKHEKVIPERNTIVDRAEPVQSKKQNDEVEITDEME